MSTFRHARSMLSSAALLLGLFFLSQMSSPGVVLAQQDQALTADTVQRVTSLTRIGTYPLPSQELRYLLTHEPETTATDEGRVLEKMHELQGPGGPLLRLVAQTSSPKMHGPATASQKQTRPELASSTPDLAFPENVMQKVSHLTHISQMIPYTGVNTIVAMFDSLTSNYYQIQDEGPFQAHVRFFKTSPLGVEAKLEPLNQTQESFQSELVLEFNY